LVGDLQSYYIRVDSALGGFPQEANSVSRVVESAESGKTYETSATVFGLKSWHRFRRAPREGDAYQLRVSFDVPHEIIHGQGLYSEGPEAAVWTQPGLLDVYLVDAVNHAHMQDGEQFDARLAELDASTGELVLSFPKTKSDLFLVFSNYDHVANVQVLDVEASLYRNPEAVGPPGIFLPLAANAAEMRPATPSATPADTSTPNSQPPGTATPRASPPSR
jgi:hypothetical protein